MLTIHAKLVLSGVDDPARGMDVQRSRDRLLAFLGQIGTVIENAEQARGAVIGTDPQLGELALRFLASGSEVLRRSRSPDLPLAKLAALVKSERPEDLN